MSLRVVQMQSLGDALEVADLLAGRAPVVRPRGRGPLPPPLPVAPPPPPFPEPLEQRKRPGRPRLEDGELRVRLKRSTERESNLRGQLDWTRLELASANTRIAELEAQAVVAGAALDEALALIALKDAALDDAIAALENS